MCQRRVRYAASHDRVEGVTCPQSMRYSSDDTGEAGREIGGRGKAPAGIEAVHVDLNPALRFRSLRGAFERDKPVTPGDAEFDDGYPSMPSVRARCAAWRTPHVYCGYSPRCSVINVVNVLLIDLYANRRIDAVVWPRRLDRGVPRSSSPDELVASANVLSSFHCQLPIARTIHMRNIRVATAHRGAVAPRQGHYRDSFSSPDSSGVYTKSFSCPRVAAASS